MVTKSLSAPGVDGGGTIRVVGAGCGIVSPMLKTKKTPKNGRLRNKGVPMV